MNDPQDEEGRSLAIRCLEGATEDVRAFVQYFQHAVFAVCFRMLGHRQDAEDVAQETMIRAVRHLSQWDPARPFRPWLFQIATNRCKTWLSKRRPTPIDRDIIEHLVDVPTGSVSFKTRTNIEAGLQGEIGEEIQRALNQLREEYRLSFVLFYLEELTVQEVAAAMECAENTVKTWLRRGRLEMASILHQRGFTGRID